MRIAPLLLISIFLISTMGSQTSLTFGSLGLNFQIFGGGKVFKEADYLSSENRKNVGVIVTIYYKLSKSENSTISFKVGVNNQTLNFTLDINPENRTTKVTLQEINHIWVNASVEKANLTVYPNSTIQIKNINQGAEKTAIEAAFYTSFIAPIILLVYRRLRKVEEKEKIVTYRGE